MTIYSQISENKIKTWVTMAGFILVFSTFFYLIGKLYSYNPVGYFVLGLMITSITTGFSYFFSDKIVLWSVGATPANNKEHFDFYTVTQNLAIASGLPMPKLYVINDNSMNAFATGRDPKNAVICATAGLLNRLERSEIEAVISHELSHIKNYDVLLSTIVAVLVGSLAMVADLIRRNLWFSGFRKRDNDRSSQNPITLIFFLIAIIITPLIATLIQLAISRKREYLADASGALMTRHPMALATALDKISNDNYHLKTANSSTAHLFISNPLTNEKDQEPLWLVSLFSTHPPVAERIKVLKSM